MSPGGRRRPLVIAGVIGAVVLLLVVVGVIAVLVLSERVTGTSMLPTLHDGDRVIVTPGSGGGAHRFDVVVANDPTRPGTKIVKRVIAVPGDAIEIRGGTPATFQVLVRPGNAGRWYRVDAPAWAGQWLSPTSCCGAGGAKSQYPTVRVLPKGDYFLMGDNPDVSIDSRTFGWVRGAKIDGRLGLRAWPLSADRGIGNRPHLVPVTAPPR